MSNSNEFALTTIDNPWSPFENFGEWYAYDTMKGYNTCGYLARIAKTSENYPDDYNDKIISDAIDEIIEVDPLHIYRKVYKNQGTDKGIGGS